MSAVSRGQKLSEAHSEESAGLCKGPLLYHLRAIPHRECWRCCRVCRFLKYDFMMLFEGGGAVGLYCFPWHFWSIYVTVIEYNVTIHPGPRNPVHQWPGVWPLLVCWIQFHDPQDVQTW